MIRTRLFLAIITTAGAFTFTGCSTSPDTPEARDMLKNDSIEAIGIMTRLDSGLSDRINTAYAYVIFPSVGKGGAAVGGAYGRGEVFQHGKLVGYADLSQGSIGVELGAQSYAELIVFESQQAFERFTGNRLEFNTAVSAVAVRTGAAEASKYADGVLVFTHPQGGLMVEASVDGQQFTYQPVSNP